VKWAQWDKTHSRELSGPLICVCIALCTIIAHNIAQNRPDNFPSYPPDNHRFQSLYLASGRRRGSVWGACPRQEVELIHRKQLLGCGKRPKITDLWHADGEMWRCPTFCGLDDVVDRSDRLRRTVGGDGVTSGRRRGCAGTVATAPRPHLTANNRLWTPARLISTIEPLLPAGLHTAQMPVFRLLKSEFCHGRAHHIFTVGVKFYSQNSTAMLSCIVCPAW